MCATGPLGRSCRHSALGYVTPKDMLEGRQAEIFAQRECKLQQARQQRVTKRKMKQQEALELTLDEKRELVGRSPEPMKRKGALLGSNLPEG
jgi:hypothetical protein